MRPDSRLARVLHVLLHLEEMDAPATSAAIGEMLNTNAAVVRRTMAGLREHGYVRSAKGHGGGWVLARPLSEITLLGLYEALGSPVLFAVGRADDAPKCLMEQAANAATGRALDRAADTFAQALAGVTMADLAADFAVRLAAAKATGRGTTPAQRKR